MKARILIAEEDRNLSEVLRGIFRRLDNRIKVETQPQELRRELETGDWNVFFCDARLLNAGDGTDLLDSAQKRAIPVVVTASYACRPAGEEAVGRGAFACLTKPFREAEAIAMLEGALALSSGGIKPPEPAVELEEIREHFGCLVGEHPCMQSLYSQITKISGTDMTVLIRGESGTGKELVARAIHSAGRRAGKPFVAVNCASLGDQLLESELFGHVKGAFTGAFRNKEGLFQAAAGGTLFLDEIGSVSMAMQQSLLRVLEEKAVRPVGGTESIPVDTRVVAATNEPMEKQIEEGRFRLDLYHRLSVFPLFLPPLRERPEDIELLAEHILRKNGSGAHLTSGALAVLKSCPWPGNVRQLENVLVRVLAMASPETELIDVDALPADLRPGEQAENRPEHTVQVEADKEMTLKAYLKSCERAYLRQTLARHGGSKEEAARVLGISLATFYRKFEELS